MIKLTPRRQGLWELLFVGFCQLLPLIFGIPLLATGLIYLYKGELVGSILILAGALLTLLVFFIGVLPQLRMDQRARRLMNTGDPAQGEIVHSEFSGTLINNLPQYRLQIRYVHPRTGQEHIARTVQVVDYSAALCLTPGTSVPLRVSRDQPDHIAIE